MAMLRPGLHFHNACGITNADLDLIRRWSPLSLLEVMDGIVRDQPGRLREAWELAGRPPLVLRRYYEPRRGGPAIWGAHAMESVGLARLCLAAGIPLAKLMLKPFNEPNMPEWANWEGFGDTEDAMIRYNEALLLFIEIAKRELPGITIGGPHLTVGNRDVRFPNDPVGVYYYHGVSGQFEASRCSAALSALDVHFVHCYGMHPGQYQDRAHGLRFLEYEKYLKGKDIYIVEGAYGIDSGQPANANIIRGEETVAYLHLLGENYPQVKGIALWIGGDPHAGWFAFCHADGSDPGSHRPVVFAVEEACKGEEPTPEPEPPPEPEPEPPPSKPEFKARAFLRDGSEVEPEQLLAAYSMEIHSIEGTGFRVVEIRERCEANNCDVWARGVGGELLVGWDIRWGWGPPPTEVIGQTGNDGRVGFPMTRDAYYDPAITGGPHWTAISGNSERVTGIGMVAGTVHCTLNFVFQYILAEEPEPEPPPPEPRPYSLALRLSQAPHGFAEMREAVKQVAGVNMDRVRAESLMAGRITQAGDPLFGKLRHIVIHRMGGEYHGVLALTDWEVNSNPDIDHATCPYHLIVEATGRLVFAVPFWCRTRGAAGANDFGIHICFEDEANEKQMETGRFAIAALYEFMGQGWGEFRLLGLMPHSMVWNGEAWHTGCPGEVWPKLLWSGAWPKLREEA